MRRGRLVAGYAVALGLMAIPMRTSHATTADRLQTVFERGNRAYFDEHYGRAAKAYARLVDAGVHDPDVYFNLATVHARAGHYGHAVLYYERALRARPGDEGAGEALEEVERRLRRRRADSERGQDADLGGWSIWKALARPFTGAFFTWSLLGLDVVVFALLMARRFVRKEAARLALAIAIPLLAGAMLLAGAGLLAKTDVLWPGRPAVVLHREAVLRQAPDPHASPVTTAYEGQHVRIMDQTDGFAQVRVGDTRGWMAASDVEAI